MGHGSCGGCAAALTGQFDGAQHGAGRFIASWVELAGRGPGQPCSAKHAELDPKAFLEMELEAVQRLASEPADLPVGSQNAKAAGKLALHGCHFSIADGKL